eukprot:7356302-Alexandrium_andersonii.AAC.1
MPGSQATSDSGYSGSQCRGSVAPGPLGDDEAGSASARTAGAHAPCGAVCKYCKRADTSPNPLVYQRSSQPMLPWRRQFGLECRICPWAIQAHTDYAKMTAKDLLKLAEDNNDSEKLASFMASVVT